MIGGVITLAYLATVIAVAAGFMRWAANNLDRCPQSYGYCKGSHVTTCWRGDGTVGIREVWAGMLVGALWPVSLIPLAAYAIATHKPTPKANAAYIADLERRCGIAA